MTSTRRYDALDHLTDSQVSALIQRYYAGEPVRSLLAEFAVNCSPGSLWRHLPAIPTGEACPACGSPLVERFGGRTTGVRHTPSSRCSNCRHRQSPDCACSYCNECREEARRAEEKRRRQSIGDICRERWDYSVRDIAPADLPARAAFALICVVRSGGWLDPKTVGSLDRGHPRFAPFEIDFWNSIPQAVIASQLAAPSPESPLDAFPDNTTDTPNWNPEGVYWQLLMPDPSSFVHELELLISERVWPKGWAEEIRALWLELAIAECVEWGVRCAIQRDLPTPCHTALSSLLKNLLVDHSVSQVFGLLSAAITDTDDFRARRQISRAQAEHFIVGACQRLADQARTEGSAIKELPRDPILERTQASYVLHDLFLGLGEAGFYRVIPRG